MPVTEEHANKSVTGAVHGAPPRTLTLTEWMLAGSCVAGMGLTMLFLASHAPELASAALAVPSGVEPLSVGDALCMRSFALAEQSFIHTAMLKFAQLMLGAVLACVGALFVIARLTAAYHLGADGGAGRAELRTSSPGLVLITLSLGLMALSTYRPLRFNYQPAAACFPMTVGSSARVLSTSAQGDVDDALPPMDDPPPDDDTASTGEAGGGDT